MRTDLSSCKTDAAGAFNKCDPTPARQMTRHNFALSVINQAIAKVKRYWNEKGVIATVLAIAATILGPLLRRRRRLVFETSLEVPRVPSIWDAGEQLLVIGSEDVSRLSRKILTSLEVDRHREDLESLPKGNRLFIVTNEAQYLHRGYVCISDPPAVARHERKAIFFGRMQSLPMIRSCETAPCARGKGLYRRVLNEQLRYLQKLGYSRAVLYVMAENTGSIKGAMAAGFKLGRMLTDWIFLNSLVLQIAREGESRVWRVFLQ